MKPRKLSLRQEALADLTTDQLSDVVGASASPTRCRCTIYWPSVDLPCTDLVDELTTVTGIRN